MELQLPDHHIKEFKKENLILLLNYKKIMICITYLINIII